MSVESLQGGPIDAAEAARLADRSSCSATRTRARILYALLDHGELNVTDIADVVGVPETSVSHALRLLRTAGIVRNRRAGRMIYYALDDAHVRMVLTLSLEHLRHGTGDG